MARTLCMQCDSGISGDMVVGALLDLGASEGGLREALRGLGLEGYSIRVTRKVAGALDGCDFDVVLDNEHENHDHDMEWLFGEDVQDHHAHGHEHRNLASIRAILEASTLSERVRKTALDIFEVIALAEAKAHGMTAETVYFHEVGAIDSIVDVVAVAWCIDDLGVDNVVVGPLGEGEGHIRCAHGVLPVPVPAVASIVEAHGLVMRRLGRKGEFVTPTGAAIAAALGNASSLPAQYRIVGTGVGTGKRAYDPPSFVRALLVEEAESSTEEAEFALWKLETEVDDCTGESLAYALKCLYAEGAREVHFIPVFMKKNRPGYQVEVICTQDRVAPLEELLFENTTTIGVRRYPIYRSVLPREESSMQTRFGVVATKRVTLPSGEVREYPEHDSVAALAQEHGVSYLEVLRSVTSVG